MQRVLSSELSAHVGERVPIAGWFHNLRRLKTQSFLLVRDRGGIAQVVLDDAQVVDELAACPRESVLAVSGTAWAEPQAPNGVELRNASIEVVARAAEAPPLELFRPTLAAQLPTLLDHAAVALRHPRQRAIFEISAAAVEGFRTSLRAQSFVEVHTPKIVGSATEGGANVFRVNYMGEPAYLAQSLQLYKQMLVGVFERVFEVGPVFRAEPHDTPRHLNEYVSLDAEMGFIESHVTVMGVLRRVIADMVEAVAERAGPALRRREIALPAVPSEIPMVHFSEAQHMISAATGENLEGEPDLAPAHERWLGEWARREHGSELVFVVGYPMVKRPFYTHADPARPEFSNSFDLLFRGLELSTGGQRLHLYTDYINAMAERGMDEAPFEAYLEAFQHGMPPHGGFAIGLERWVAQLIGAANVRETTLFPRDLHRLSP